PRDYFPNASSIWDGIRENVAALGGSAMLSEDGSFNQRPDVAIVVFGERPYAEFAGDQADLVFRDEEGLSLLKQFAEADIPTVAVFLSGRPLWMNREINAADAFVASWLPGSEGAGVADVLTGTMQATGRLSFSWPATCEGNPLNSAEGALFAFGYGRELSDHSSLRELTEECDALTRHVGAEWFASGRLADSIKARADNAVLPNLRGTGNGITAVGIDRNAQEDARRLTFAAGSTLLIEQDGTTTSSEGSADAFRIVYRVEKRPVSTVMMTVGDSQIDITHPLSVAEGKGWREMVLTSECASAIGGKIEWFSEGKLSLEIATITREGMAEGTACSF
ncbi:MAG TPA: 1,4-beta-D-glucan glucohydrolase, partial [Erythrobacter sp.]|nr:1,4-beta-D-glucan glucohydrolase [Erythrobacter sp.]